MYSQVYIGYTFDTMLGNCTCNAHDLNNMCIAHVMCWNKNQNKEKTNLPFVHL